MMSRSIFSGLSAFPLTPASSDGVVDTEAFAVMLDRLAAAGVDSITVLGSTGVYAYLDRAERSRALAAAIETVAGRVPLIAGVGAMRTAWATELARDAESAGADALLLAPVSYTPLTEAEVFTHFETVAGSTGLPLCIYNNPGTTHFSFTETLIARLSRVPRIAAIKMPPSQNGDYSGEMRRLRAGSDAGLAIGYSGDWVAAPALLAGANAWFSVVAGLLPDAALRLTRAAMAGQEIETESNNAAFEPLWALFRKHSSLRVMYAIAACLGLRAGAPPLPIQPLDSTSRGAVDEIMDRLAVTS
jgi:4-hydroxy-tetrahydrodipicolinate synthase